MVGKEEHSLEGKLAVAEVEKVFKRRAEEIENHGIVIAFGTEPPNERNTNTTSEGLVDFGLILELGVLSLDGLELDGDFLARNDVDTEVDITLKMELIHGSAIQQPLRDSPKEPEPIFLPRRYLPPTRRSMRLAPGICCSAILLGWVIRLLGKRGSDAGDLAMRTQA